MGKYIDLQNDIFSVFAMQAWTDEGILTYPSSVVPDNPGTEFIRIDIIPSGSGVNLISTSGIVIVDIFTLISLGPKRSSEIADLLDIHLSGKSFNTGAGTTQFKGSNFSPIKQDRVNTSLGMATYSINFNHFGVL